MSCCMTFRSGGEVQFLYLLFSLIGKLDPICWSNSGAALALCPRFLPFSSIFPSSCVFLGGRAK